MALGIGLCLGVALSYIPTSGASRNSSGTYSLPAGNPVVSGTTITSSWGNTLASDISTELTSSLDRSGRGAMLAPLQCSNGTVSAPALTFGTDPDTGLYRIGANNPAMAAGATKVQEWSTTGSTFPLALAVTGAQTNAAGITVTQSVTNGRGIDASGNGTGMGVIGTGGATGHGLWGQGGSSGGSGVIGVGGASGGSGAVLQGNTTGPGLNATGGATSGQGATILGGAPNGLGVFSTGDGTGQGVNAVGGDTSGTGVLGTGGAPNGTGIYGIGMGNAPGLLAAAGTSATALATSDAIKAENGALFMAGTNPNKDVAFTNRLTGANIVKAWANVVSNGTNSPTVSAGFNITSVVCGSTGNNSFVVTMASEMTGTNDYAAVVSDGLRASNQSTTVFHITGGAGEECDTTSGVRPNFIVMGLQ